MPSSKKLFNPRVKIAVLEDADHSQQCQQLASRLNCDLIESVDQQIDYVLFFHEDKLALKSLHQSFKPIVIDFAAGKTWHRLQYGGGRGQLIARACGLKAKQSLTVLDLTAGFAQDAFVLASLGCEVTMLERSPIVAALLEDALSRVAKQDWFTNFSLSLRHCDANSYLQALKPDQTPDVIYFDPMFPDSKKTALVKKEMRVIRDLVGEDADASELLEIALAKAKKRIVVKRPKLGETLTEQKPDLVFSGKSGRFDVYLSQENINKSVY